MKKLITILILFVAFSMQAQWTYNSNGNGGVQTTGNVNRANGYYSLAVGTDATADGTRSFSMGRFTEAIGNYSTALGRSTEANGEYSYALGRSTNANGEYSFALGNTTTSNGHYSIAMGFALEASDYGTFAMGRFNTADPTPNPTTFDLANRAFIIGNGTGVGNLSDAFTVLFDGTTTIAGSVTAPSFIGDGSQLTNIPNNSGWSINANGTGVQTASNTASGDNSTAMGKHTTASDIYTTAMGKSTNASGWYSTAIGAWTVASGNRSTAMGAQTTASGPGSTAMGSFTTSIGWHSTAMGTHTTASDYGSLSIGTYNTIQTTSAENFDLANRAFIIGNGTGAGNNRSDALMVLFDGTTTIAGNVTAPAFIGDGSQLTNVGTDDQTLTLNTNSLDLEDGGSVDLSGYLDNTDSQNISGSTLAGTTLTIGIGGGTSEDIDLSPLMDSGTDDQQLTLTGNSLELEDGGTVDLSGYLDNTDNQNISGSGLAGTTLTIGIDGGTSETVDLTPLIANLIAQNEAQQALIDDLIIRMEIREQCECNGPLGVDDSNLPRNQVYLSQNVPNPFNYTTTIGYFIPFTYSKANIVISTTTGQILQNIAISKFGEGEININKELLASATYFYTLYVDGKKVDTKRMIVK